MTKKRHNASNFGKFERGPEEARKTNATNVGADPGRWQVGRSPTLKPTKVTLSIMILYNSENSIRDMRSFCGSIVLSQQCREIYFISLTVVNP